MRKEQCDCTRRGRQLLVLGPHRLACSGRRAALRPPPTELPPGTASNDADAFRADANCITAATGWQGGAPFNIYRDLRGKGSEWYKLIDIDDVIVTSKNCFPPSGLHATGSTATSISFAWDAIPGSDYKVYMNGQFLIYVPNASGPNYTVNNLNPQTSYTFQVTMKRGVIETSKSAPITVGTGSLPPPPWQWNTARQLKNVQSGLCLVVQGGDDGSQAFMHDCSIPYADQLWDDADG